MRQGEMMNISEYAEKTGRTPHSISSLCSKWNIGKREYINGRWNRILSEEDVKELDRRCRK